MMKHVIIHIMDYIIYMMVYDMNDEACHYSYHGLHYLYDGI